MKKIWLILFLGFSMGLLAQTVILHPTLRSIGVEVNNIGAFNQCEIRYKKSSETAWRIGHDADSIVIHNAAQFRGSVFLADENTHYQVEVKLTNTSTGAVLVLPVAETQTLKAPSFEPTGTIKWVAPDGLGNAYTQSNPGSLKVLLSSGQVSCGTTIMLADGLYHDFNLALNLTTDCSENQPIQFLAAPGANPVFDGGYYEPLAWTASPLYPDLYVAPLPPECAYTNTCLLDGKLLYPYPAVVPKLLLGNFNLGTLNFGWDGFARDNNSIYFKTLDGKNPANASVILSKEKRCLTIYGNNHDAWMQFKGITFRHFGVPTVNPLGSAYDAFGAVAVELRNTSYVSFDSCRFDYNENHISFTGQSNRVLIQHCAFKDGTGTWSHAMIKKSHDYVHSLFYTVEFSRARNAENGAIFLESGDQIMIHGNRFSGNNSGVVGGFDTGLYTETDIYDNYFEDNFDAIENDGNWSNLRIWNNEIVRPMAGFSLAPPQIGPRYYYRNLVYGMRDRRNEEFDPHFASCTPITQFRSWSVGIKTNSGNSEPLPGNGNVYFYNNTFYSEDSLSFSVASWNAEWRKAFFCNNIHVNTRFYTWHFFSTQGKTGFHLACTTDNFFTGNPSSPIARYNPVHGQYNCADISDVNNLQSELQATTGSDNILFINPLQVNPQFINTQQNGFELSPGSALINAGTPIKGFYDYKGARPDVGAKETDEVNETVTILAPDVFSLSPNPACNVLRLTSLSAGRDFDHSTLMVTDVYGREMPVQTSIQHVTADIQVAHLVSGLYFLTVFEEKTRQRAVMAFVKE